MLKLAWRNLWRNKRRTLITIMSVLFAVVFAVLLRGYHGGAWASLLDNVLHSYSGYLQVHAKGFWDDKNFDHSMVWNDTLKGEILKNKKIKSVIPRVESVAFASVGEKTKVVIVLGVDPVLEEQFSKFTSRLKGGSLFNANDSAAIISQRLAKFLDVKVGDTITLISQGYQGSSAAGLFRIVGIVKLPSPEFDNQMVYLPLKTAQNFFSLNSRITSLIIDIKKTKQLQKVASELSRTLGPEKYEVMTWDKMLVELYQQWISDEGGGKIFLGLLYLIIGFGIFGTVMMMVAERTREFGVLVAVGMKRNRLIRLITSEMFLISLIGVIVGMMLSVPVVAWFHFHPIELSGVYAETMAAYGMEPVIPVLWQADYILNQGLIVFFITFIAIAYPVYKIGKLNVIKALRG
jgi:ABC-type lipoprotein release transport system permease subunit